MKLCTFPDCEKKHYAKGLCYGHYRKAYNQSPKWKAYKKAYRQTPKAKAYMKAYRRAYYLRKKAQKTTIPSQS